MLAVVKSSKNLRMENKYKNNYFFNAQT